jgi:hypothetical protein
MILEYELQNTIILLDVTAKRSSEWQGKTFNWQLVEA